MNKILRSLVIALLSVIPAVAGTIPVVGTIRLANGNLFNGTIKMVLNYPARDFRAGNIVVPMSVSFKVQNGQVQSGARITPNEDLEPSHTIYVTEYFTSSGTKVAQNNFSVSSSSQFDIGSATPTAITSSNISFDKFTGLSEIDSKNINSRRMCDQFTGASAGAKVSACMADLPSTGGIADASGLVGNQTWSTCPFTGVTKNVHFILGGTADLSIDCTSPANVAVDFIQGSQFSVASGKTLTINGPIDGPASQVFAGSGTVLLPNAPVVYPQWWGAAPATTDNGPALNSAVTATACNGHLTIPPGSLHFTTQWAIVKAAAQCKFTITGAANFTTKLIWDGSTSGVPVLIEHAIRFHVSDLEILNGVAKGSTVGLEIISSAPASSDTGPAIFSNISVVGFQTCVDIGLDTDESASELFFLNLEANSCSTGINITGNQTLNISFKNLQLASNTIGLDDVKAGFVNIDGGSASADTEDFIVRVTSTHFAVRNFRSENIVTAFLEATTNGTAPIWITIEDCEMRPVSGTPTLVFSSGTGQIEWKLKSNTIAGAFSPGTGATNLEFTQNGVAAGGSFGHPFTDNASTHLGFTQYGNYALTSTTNWDIASRYNNSVGKVVSNVPQDIMMWNDNGILVNGGVNPAGTGIQHIRGSVGCTTGGVAIGDSCTSGALSWTTAFPDTNYSITCALDGTSILNKPTIMYVTKSAGSFTITIAQLTTSAATGNYDCIAMHD